MSWQVAVEGSSAEDPVLSPRDSCGLFQEDVEETGSQSGLAPHLSGGSSGAPVWAGSRKRVHPEEALQGASCQAVGAPGASVEAKARLVVPALQAVGQRQDLLPGPRLHIQLPTMPAQGRAQTCKRLLVSLHDILAGSGPRNLWSMSVGARKKSRMCEAPLEGEEGAGGFLCLGQSPGGDKPQSGGGLSHGADVESVGVSCRPLSCKDTGSGPADPGGSWEECASGIEKLESLPIAGDGAPPDTPCAPVEPPVSSGGEFPQPATQAPPQSPALCLGESGKASPEWQEAGQSLGAGGEDGPDTSHDQEELEVEAQPVSGGRPEQGLTASTDTSASSLEPAASKARSGQAAGQRRYKYATKLRRGPVPCAQDGDTERCSDHSNQEQPEESSPGGCPKLVS